MKKASEFEARTKVLVIGEYLGGKTTYRSLARKYGVPRTTVCRWVEAVRGEDASVEKEPGEASSVDVSRLMKELEGSRLENKLLNAMIDIAEEQLGVDIRKKPGARPRSCWSNSH